MAEETNVSNPEPIDIELISGAKKAAILLISIGNEAAAEILKNLPEKLVELLTKEISQLNNFSNDLKRAVLEEFNTMIKGQEYINLGGVDYARAILVRSVGPVKAEAIINRIVFSKRRPFDSIKKADSGQLLNYIQQEMPQTIAMILSYLPPGKAASILSQLPNDKQAAVTRRIALMKEISPDMVREVERVLERRISALAQEDILVAGGIDAVVEILNVTERSVEKNIIESIEESDPMLAEELKKRMFVFEDIILLDDRSIQKVLTEVDNHDLSRALKTANERVTDKVYSNMSKRAAQMIKEEIEFMGPIRLKEVEEVQQKIVGVIRKLEEQGEVIIARGEQEVFV